MRYILGVLAATLFIVALVVLSWSVEAQERLYDLEGENVPAHTLERLQQLPDGFPPREFFLEGLLLQYEGGISVTGQSTRILFQSCGEGTYWGCTKTGDDGLCRIFIELGIAQEYGLVVLDLVRRNLIAACAGYEAPRAGSVAWRR